MCLLDGMGEGVRVCGGDGCARTSSKSSSLAFLFLIVFLSFLSFSVSCSRQDKTKSGGKVQHGLLKNVARQSKERFTCVCSAKSDLCSPGVSFPGCSVCTSIWKAAWWLPLSPFITCVGNERVTFITRVTVPFCKCFHKSLREISHVTWNRNLHRSGFL